MFRIIVTVFCIGFLAKASILKTSLFNNLIFLKSRMKHFNELILYFTTENQLSSQLIDNLYRLNIELLVFKLFPSIYQIVIRQGYLTRVGLSQTQL